MVRRAKEQKPSLPATKTGAYCKIEAIITIDKRGQIVLPKKVRQRAGFTAGSNLAIIICEGATRIHCVSLVKAEHFADLVKQFLGPMLGESFTKKGGQEHAE